MEEKCDEILALLGNDPSYLSLASTAIYLTYTNEEVNADLNKMRQNPKKLFDKPGPGTVMHHETIHFWQTFYTYQLAQMHTYKGANIFYLRKQLVAENGKINLPLNKKFCERRFETRGILSSGITETGLSLLDLVEGEATFGAIKSCVGFETHEKVESYFRKIKECSESEYWKAYCYASEKLGNHSLSEFPMVCHFALAGAKHPNVETPIHPSILFKSIISFLEQDSRFQCELHEIGLHDLKEAYHKLVKTFCSKYGLEYYGPQGVARQVLQSGSLNYRHGSGALPWGPLTQIAGALCDTYKHDFFIAPAITGSTGILNEKLGQPLIICKENGTVKAYYDPDKPEQEAGYIYAFTAYNAFESMFSQRPPKLDCPHIDCTYRQLALCSQFPWVPEEPVDCLFPQIFQGLYVVPLDRLEWAESPT